MSRAKSTGTLPGIAVLASLSGPLASGTRPGLRKAGVQEKGRTRRSREPFQTSGNPHRTVFALSHSAARESSMLRVMAHKLSIQIDHMFNLSQDILQENVENPVVFTGKSGEDIRCKHRNPPEHPSPWMFCHVGPCCDNKSACKWDTAISSLLRACMNATLVSSQVSLKPTGQRQNQVCLTREIELPQAHTVAVERRIAYQHTAYQRTAYLHTEYLPTAQVSSYYSSNVIGKPDRQHIALALCLVTDIEASP